MTKRIRCVVEAVALLLAAFLAMPAAAQTSPAPAPSPPTVRVLINTTMGVILVELERAKAPITTANFLRYVDQKRFDGTVFYRAMKLGVDEAGQPQGLIQGGTQNDPKRILKPIAHEPTDRTGVKHVAGAISMARWDPGTATGDFSVLLSPMPGLDANPGGSGDTAGYAAFGRVIEGMDVVRRIHGAPISPTLGEGFMKGQMLAQPVRIVTARRAPTAPPAPVVPTPAP
jgi:peptidyl-prolyl cis-trans isomerase A (cyclophilin A)